MMYPYPDLMNKTLFDPIEQGAAHLKIVSVYAAHIKELWHVPEIK